MSVNVQLKDKLQRISGESITSAKILSALGYTPARDTDLTSHKNDSTIHITNSERSTWNNKANKDELFSGDYNDLINKPIENTDDGILYIADEQGNIVARIDSEGLHTVGVDIHGQDVALKDDFKNYYTKEQMDNKIDSNTFSGDYNDLTNKPIENTDDGILYITDPEGNIVARIDENGIETHQLTAKKLLLNGVDLDTALGSKAEQTYVNTELAKKANLSDMNAVLATKADITYVDAEVGKKADTTYVDNQLKLKADKDELFSQDYNDLINKPIENTDDGTLQIADEDGNVIMKVDSEGVTTYDVKIHSGENIVSVKELIDESIESVRPVAGDHIAIGTDKSINVITESVDANDTSHPVSKNYVDKKVTDLINGAPEALDTLKELGDALDAHEDAYDALLETVGKKADRTELPTISAGNNINVNNTGRDYTVSLKDSIQVTDINTETANVTKLQVHESITAPQFIQESNSLQVTDESGNISFEVDSTGKTSIAELYVRTSDPAADDIIVENILDLIEQSSAGSVDPINVGQAKTISTISQEKGKIKVETVDISIEQSQVEGLADALSGKQNQIQNYSKEGATSKTVTKVVQNNGAVDVTYADISIAQSQVQGLEDTINGIPKTTVSKGSYINVTPTTTGSTTDYKVELGDDIAAISIETDSLVVSGSGSFDSVEANTISAPQFVQNGDNFIIADESGNKTLEVDKEGKTTIADLHVKIGEEIKHISDVVVAHVHPYTPSGVINEEVVEDITSTSKSIDDMVVLPAMTMTHSPTNSTLVFAWNAGSVSQDNIVTSVGAVNITPTFTGTPSTTDVPTGTDASSVIEPYVARKLDESY